MPIFICNQRCFIAWGDLNKDKLPVHIRKMTGDYFSSDSFYTLSGLVGSGREVNFQISWPQKTDFVLMIVK